MKEETLKKNILKASLVYLALITAVYFPVVFCGRTLSMAARFPWFKSGLPRQTYDMPNTFNVDIAHPAAYEEALDVFIGNQLRQGVLPLWNPYQGCGITMIGQFSTRVIFPFQILQNIFGWVWRDFFLLFRVFAAALGVFIFLKVLGLGFYPSLAGGIIFGFSGSMTIMLTLTEKSNHSMLMPYVLLGCELLNRKINLRSISFLSITAALLVLADQPEVSFYALILVVCYYFFRISVTRDEVSWNKKAFIFLLAMLIALIISSPLYVPFLMNSGEYYHLHPPGSTMGVQSPAPVSVLMASVFPEFMRYRMSIAPVTVNFGWDYLGGYLGPAACFLILAGIKKKWWGRKTYLFFLVFGALMVLKNIGVPPVSWIGHLPVFDQVWTPRWTGAVWSLPLILAAAMGFEALLSGFKDKPDDKTGKPDYLLMIPGFFIIFLGFFLHYVLWTFVELPEVLLRFIIVFRWVLFIPGYAAVVLSLRKMRYFWAFAAILALVIISVARFPFTLLQYSPISLIAVTDKLQRISIWQGMAEAVIAGVGLSFSLLILLNRDNVEENLRALTGTSVIVLGMMFHVTLGYGETARAIRLFFYALILCVLLIYTRKKTSVVRIRNTALISLPCLALIGFAGARNMPVRESPFEYPQAVRDYDGISRIMGIRGVTFPNSSSVYEIQDVKSIVSTSIERFQLFQDYCLSVIPQGKYHSLWYTGIMDKVTGVDIAGNIRARSEFFSLAGIGSYLSNKYENLPDTEIVYDGIIKKYRNKAAMPRAFMVRDWEISDSPQSSLRWMLENSGYFSEKAVVEDAEREEIPETFIPRQGELDYSVKFESYNINSLILRVEVPEPALLVLTDTYHPEWRARVNGVETEIYPVNLAFRGLFIEPGTHKVEFIYSPKSFYLPLIFSGLTLSGLFFLLLLNKKCD